MQHGNSPKSNKTILKKATVDCATTTSLTGTSATAFRTVSRSQTLT